MLIHGFDVKDCFCSYSRGSSECENCPIIVRRLNLEFGREERGGLEDDSR